VVSRGRCNTGAISQLQDFHGLRSVSEHKGKEKASCLGKSELQPKKTWPLNCVAKWGEERGVASTGLTGTVSQDLEKLSMLIDKPIAVFSTSKLSDKFCTLSYPPMQEVIHMSTANALSSLEQNKALVVRWFEELWNQGRRETIEELFAAQGVLHDGASTYTGPEEFTSFYDKLSAEFSQFSIRPIVSLAEGSFACIHWSANCVHTPSGKRVRLTGTSVVRISNGQFVEAWQNWDAAGLAAQLQDEIPQNKNPA